MEIFQDIAQIFILYLVFYAILRRSRGSRFGQALMGVGVLSVALAAFTYLFHFYVLAQIIMYLLIYFAISTVVIFQPEIRRMLATVGAFGSFDKQQNRGGETLTAETFTDMLVDLASRRMGALFAFERGISLKGYEETGVKIDALLSKELIISIFTPPLPLHDGGAVIRNGRLSSAHCIFPVSNNPDLIESGMRHRAAVGMSEETDALVLVVSEESGLISVAHNGKLYRYSGTTSQTSILRWVRKALKSKSREQKLLQSAAERIQRILFKPPRGNQKK